MKCKTLVTLSLLVFVFLLGFSFSVQAYAIRQKELNSPVSQYLRENYGVNSIEEYEAKLEQQAWLNYSKQMQSLASEYPELNLPQNYMQAGTSTYQPPTFKSEQPFYAVVLGEPVVSLQVFSLSGLGLLGLAAVPPVKKRKQLRQALILGIAVLCVFSVGYFVGLTVAQTGTITIEPNSFQTEASYIIFTDGTMVYARNGTTGAIDYNGTDAATVINSVANALTSGGLILLKGGTYSITSKVSLPYQGLILQGESPEHVVLNLSGDGEISIETGYITIKNFEILADSTKNAINTDSVSGDHRWITLENLHMYRYNSQYLVSLNDVNEVLIIRGCYFADAGTKAYWTRAALVRLYITGAVHSGNAFIYGNSLYNLVAESETDTPPACILIENNSTVAKDFQYADIFANHFWSGGDSNSAKAYGIVLYAVTRYISTINVFDNRFENIKCLYAIYTGGYGGSFIIHNNWVKDDYTTATRPLIYASDLWKECKIIGNVLWGTYAINMTHNYSKDRNVAAFNSTSGTITCEIVEFNLGYATENSGTSSLANGDWFAHGLVGTPTIVILTPQVGTYGGAPFGVSVNAKNSTHVQVSVYWYNGTAITVAQSISWYAKY